jgi:hypothetical protein
MLFTVFLHFLQIMNSRTKGHDFERKMAEKLREVWPNCYTQRFKGSLWMDHCGIDLVNTPPFNFQLKATERPPGYHKILSAMPKGRNINVILHKRNNKGIVAVLSYDDFLKIINSKFMLYKQKSINI